MNMDEQLRITRAFEESLSSIEKLAMFLESAREHPEYLEVIKGHPAFSALRREYRYKSSAPSSSSSSPITK